MEIRSAALIGAGAVGAFFIRGLSEKLGDNFCIIAEGERAQKVHAVLVDLDHSYEEYVGIQDSMEFDVLTRRIR